MDRNASTHVKPSIQSRNGLFYPTYYCAPHHCLSNSYSVHVNLPSTCSWSTLPRVTIKRVNFSLVCLPPDEGGLIAIKGYNNRGRIDVVECLAVEDATEWRWLARLPLTLASLGGGVYKQRILVVGGSQRTVPTPCLHLHPRPQEAGSKFAASSFGRKKCNRQGKHPKARSSRQARAKDYLDRFFTKGKPFCFFAPETSKPTPDHIATLVVTQSATAPRHCAAPLQIALPCPTSSSPAAASTVHTC